MNDTSRSPAPHTHDDRSTCTAGLPTEAGASGPDGDNTAIDLLLLTPEQDPPESWSYDGESVETVRQPYFEEAPSWRPRSTRGPVLQ